MQYNTFMYAWLFWRKDLAPSIICPIIINLLKPKSVLDVWCGIGYRWVHFLKHNIEYVWCDQDFIDKKDLVIPEANFFYHNLEKPLSLDKKFDLVMSLEVWEHIDKKYAQQYVESLVNHWDIILFSAATPWQEWVFHINEQFPDYRSKIFQNHWYVCLDIIREKISSKDTDTPVYRQNMFVYVKDTIYQTHFAHLTPFDHEFYTIHYHIINKLKPCFIVVWKILECKNQLIYYVVSFLRRAKLLNITKKNFTFILID
jgi:hypothetical protein